MAYVVLQQVSSKYAKSNVGKTLEKPVALKYLERYIPAEKLRKIKEGYPEGHFYIWGAKFERYHQIPKMIPGQSLVLFRRGRRVLRVGVIKDLFVCEELALKLWGTDEVGDTWGIVYLMQKVRDVSIDAVKINEAIGRKPNDNWQGMTSVDGEKAAAAIGIVKAYLDEHQP
ncbi:hypothetical protein DYI41_05055 [Marinobacter salarius]|uniref:hypothetical protein n=1 Tax=Marinobacter salarius TaxID=1420917 RepID=UPI001BCFD879|nr:hypothetical protein [Marinobacter salarius]MBS8230293.1 hypothetical protein [Marinobacter salarius]